MAAGFRDCGLKSMRLNIHGNSTSLEARTFVELAAYIPRLEPERKMCRILEETSWYSSLSTGIPRRESCRDASSDQKTLWNYIKFPSSVRSCFSNSHFRPSVIGVIYRTSARCLVTCRIPKPFPAYVLVVVQLGWSESVCFVVGHSL